jgi:hypothetical protein
MSIQSPNFADNKTSKVIVRKNKHQANHREAALDAIRHGVNSKSIMINGVTLEAPNGACCVLREPNGDEYSVPFDRIPEPPNLLGMSDDELRLFSAKIFKSILDTFDTLVKRNTV